MSVHASLGAVRARSSTVVQLALAAGTGAAVAVAVGGLSLGFIIWYGLVVHARSHPFADELTLLVALGTGLLGGFAAWYRYAGYLSRRARVPREAALRLDAWSWPALALFPLLVSQPFWVVSNGRAVGTAVAAFGLVKLVTAARLNQTVRDVLITFVVTRVPILVIAELASVIIGQRSGTHIAESANPLLVVWGRWDAVHYLDIAQRGYYGTDMAFFPLFPALINLLGRLIGNDLVAGLIISNSAAFFGSLFFYKLVEHQYNRAVAHRAIFYVSIFPTAVFFSAVYTEALFFALTVASFYYIREHRWLAAGLLGGLAALTRAEGVLLVVPYAIEVGAAANLFGWRSYFGSPQHNSRLLLGGALIPAGLGIYMAFLWVLTGDPLYFSHVQAHWDRHFAAPWVSVVHSIATIAHTNVGVTIANQALEIAFTALMIAILIGGLWRLRPSYSAYMAISILVPMSTSSLMSMPRFALVLFPMFVTLALWGNRSWVNNAIVAFSLPLLGLFTVLFADWYWVA
ncbi:MAG: mannosyltransferase family protein [Vulcanimicrobiaceae bacterium]